MAHKTPFWLKPYQIQKGEHRSPRTQFQPHASWVEIPCKVCGKMVRLTKNKAEKYWKGCCSKKCGTISVSGEKHPNWQEGRSRTNQKIRASSELRKWRYRVLARDNFVCQRCGKPDSWHANHIKSFAQYPELRAELSNGETLCKECDIISRRKNGGKR